jgi:hypothetical protein
MARNLQAKLPSSDTIRIYDINVESMKRFADETKALSRGAAVEVVSSVREASKDSVSFPKNFLLRSLFYPSLLRDEFVLSMI